MLERAAEVARLVPLRPEAELEIGLVGDVVGPREAGRDERMK